LRSYHKMIESIPIEILYRILRYLDVDDLVRPERVNKLFVDMMSHRIVWSQAYQHAHLMRPPEPFLW